MSNDVSVKMIRSVPSILGYHCSPDAHVNVLLNGTIDLLNNKPYNYLTLCKESFVAEIYYSLNRLHFYHTHTHTHTHIYKQTNVEKRFNIETSYAVRTERIYASSVPALTKV